MIYDRLDQLKTYLGISRNLDTAIAWLAANDAGKLAMGKYPVDGEKVIVLAQSYETKERTLARFEAHRRYIDIQLVTEGQEQCYATPLSNVGASEPFSAENDIGFYGEPASGEVALPMLPGTFAVFFPQDAHKPSCDLDVKRPVRKIVVKVAV